MGSHFQSSNRKICHEGLYHFCKTQPENFIYSKKEFQPSLPCLTCFTSSNLRVVKYEDLGVRNLLSLDYSSNEITRLSKILSRRFHSVQVHQGQIEHLIKQKSTKVYFANYQDLLDQQILIFTLGTFQEYPQFNQKLPDVYTFHLKRNWNGEFSHIIFLNVGNPDQHLDALISQLRSHSKNCKIEFIPTSISYDFHPTFNSTKSNVRINFGQPYYFEDINELKKAGENTLRILKQHVRHDLWKNTAIMPIHVISVLNYYKSWLETSPSEYIPIMKEFQNDYLSSYDLGYIGNAVDIINYGFSILSTNGPSSKSIALDVMKHESMMMTSLLAIVNLDEKNIHLGVVQIYENQLFENFRILTRILTNEVIDIYPPCTTSSLIEKQAVEFLIIHSVVSYHDDQECEMHQSSRKLAKHLDLELEVDFDEDFGPGTPTYPKTIVYVNVENLLIRKWISKITSSLLEIYYVAARTLLELQKVDVLEYNIFVNQVAKDFTESFEQQTESYFETTVRNAIDLFEKEGIISVQNLYNVKIMFLNNPLDNQIVLQLINDIAQLIRH